MEDRIALSVCGAASKSFHVGLQTPLIHAIFNRSIVGLFSRIIIIQLNGDVYLNVTPVGYCRRMKIATP